MYTNARQLRDQTAKHGLERTRCEQCSRINDPHAGICYQCGAEDLSAIELTPEGEVVTFIVQHYLPQEFDTPLPIGVAETPEGGNVLGMFTEVQEPHGIAIGEHIEIVLKRFAREDGRVLYESKFRPVEGSDSP
jgi:uncharacterized OB-fold protein